MKKVIILLLCVITLMIPLSVSAEEFVPNEGEITTEGDNNTPETETPTEGENSGGEDYEIGDVFEGEVPEDTSSEDQPPIEQEPPAEIPSVDENPEDTAEDTMENEVKAVTDAIVKWLEAHSAEILQIITLIGYGIVGFKKLGTVIKSTGVLNNNAVTIARNSKESVDAARDSIVNVANAVTGYDEKIGALLAAFAISAEENKQLKEKLDRVENYLKVNADANIEFANVLAELLGLSNIPNYKKEEIGSRHVAAVRAILDAEAQAKLPTEAVEVKENDGEEA